MQNMTAEKLAFKLVEPGQQVVTVNDSAYIVSGKNIIKIEACIYNDFGALIVHCDDQTDCAEYDEILCELMQLHECLNTGI